MVQVQLFLLLIFFKAGFSQDVCQTGEGNPIICKIIIDIQKFINDSEPLIIEELPLNFTSESFKGYLQLNNVNLTGLYFDATQADLKLIEKTATIGLNFPSILLQAAYIGDLKIIDIIHLYGGGNLQININDLSLSAEVKIDLITQKISHVKITLKLSNTEVKTVITGLFDDPFMSSIISRQLSKTITTLLREQEQALNKLLEIIIDEYINSVLEKLFKK